jgi:hypothetical protein
VAGFPSPYLIAFVKISGCPFRDNLIALDVPIGYLDVETQPYTESAPSVDDTVEWSSPIRQVAHRLLGARRTAKQATFAL